MFGSKLDKEKLLNEFYHPLEIQILRNLAISELLSVEDLVDMKFNIPLNIFRGDRFHEWSLDSVNFFINYRQISLDKLAQGGFSIDPYKLIILDPNPFTEEDKALLLEKNILLKENVVIEKLAKSKVLTAQKLYLFDFPLDTETPISEITQKESVEIIMKLVSKKILSLEELKERGYEFNLYFLMEADELNLTENEQKLLLEHSLIARSKPPELTNIKIIKLQTQSLFEQLADQINKKEKEKKDALPLSSIENIKFKILGSADSDLDV